MNITITVPAGSSNHGNPHLLCTPPAWYDYVVFYFSNYFAHAATVITTPGQGIWETTTVTCNALLLPASGMMRALAAIQRCSRFQSDPLERALRAGALCMVVKAQRDRAQEGDPQSLEEGRTAMQLFELSKDGRRHARIPSRPSVKALASFQFALLSLPKFRASEASQERSMPWWNPRRPVLVPRDAAVHGLYHLPSGYALAFVPLRAAGHLKAPEKASSGLLASSYNIPKVLISLTQAVWAIITLYRARGDQIQQYGYAAFGLTVAPYAFMSIMNIVGSLLNPEYPALFLVRTPPMAQAESAGGFFAAEVDLRVDDAAAAERPGPQNAAARHESRPADVAPNPTRDRDGLLVGGPTPLGVLAGCIPLVVIGGLSRFQAQGSSSLQRGFTMSWVVMGIVGGLVMHVIRGIARAESDDDEDSRITEVSVSIMYGIPAIGGMVVVGLMIRDYGICTLLS